MTLELFPSWTPRRYCPLCLQKGSVAEETSPLQRRRRLEVNHILSTVVCVCEKVCMLTFSCQWTLTDTGSLQRRASALAVSKIHTRHDEMCLPLLHPRGDLDSPDLHHFVSLLFQDWDRCDCVIEGTQTLLGEIRFLVLCATRRRLVPLNLIQIL